MRSLVITVAIAITTACSHAAPPCGAPTTAPTPAGVQVLHFASADGVAVTADLYAPLPETAPMIVLFHQAGYSRGEYRAIAPKLNQLGFNALAVDTRSGHAAEGVGNDTAAAACSAGLPATYVDAIADIRAAVVEARKHARGKLLIWGSSYTSSLVLVLGSQLAVDGVLAFSPGEYFVDLGKPKTWVADSAAGLTMPVFIASATSERDAWQPIAAHIAHVTTFVPPSGGHHGSSALWAAQPEHAAYWSAVTSFLTQFTK